MRLLSVLFITLIFHSYVNAIVITATDVKVYTPTMNFGYVLADFVYDDGTKTFTASYTYQVRDGNNIITEEHGYSEIYDLRVSTASYLYTEGDFCSPRCGQAPAPYSFPTLSTMKGWTQQTGYVVEGRTCTKYTNPNDNAIFKSISLAGSDHICDFVMQRDNKRFVIDPTKYVHGAGAQPFEIPEDCGCGNRIDVVFVLDRSLSIARNSEGGVVEWPNMRNFSQEFVRRVNFPGENGVPLTEGANIGFSHFHIQRWSTLTVGEGVSRAVVTGSYGPTFNCAPTEPHCLGQSNSAACCPSGSAGTNIARGIFEGVENLRTSNRPTAHKVILVLTDGEPNYFFNGTGPCPNLDSNGGCPTSGQNSFWRTQILAEIRQRSQAAVDEFGERFKIVAVGIGAVNLDTLDAITLDKNENKFHVQNFNALQGIIDQVISSSCEPNTVPCENNQCAFCTCNETPQLPFCEGGDVCHTVGPNAGTCCIQTPIPVEEICDSKFCEDVSCVVDEGGCVYTLKQNPPCPASDACKTWECDPNQGTLGGCVVTEDVDCCLADEDCETANKCQDFKCEDNKCVYTNKVCPVANSCEIATCDPAVGCGTNPRSCPASTNCADWNCDPTTILPANPCKSTPKDPNPCAGECETNTDCDDNDDCTIDACLANYTCAYTEVVCSSSNPCGPQVCLPQGGCTAQPVSCRAGDDCTTWQCYENVTVGNPCLPTTNPDCANSECVEDVDCANRVTIDHCFDYTCVDGKCNPAPVTCPSTTCGSSKCDPKSASIDTRCVVVTPDGFCDDNNPCTIDTCVEGEGCVHEAVICEPMEGDDNCTVRVCSKLDGCSATARICADPDLDEACFTTTTDGSTEGSTTGTKPNCDSRSDVCRIFLCEKETGDCVARVVTCAGANVGAAVAGTVLSVGAIIGIAAALLVFFGAAGGGAYAATNAFGDGGATTTVNNPMYTGQGNATVNVTA